MSLDRTPTETAFAAGIRLFVEQGRLSPQAELDAVFGYAGTERSHLPGWISLSRTFHRGYLLARDGGVDQVTIDNSLS